MNIVDCIGVRVAKLLSWQERITSLQDLGMWELAVLLGLDIYETALTTYPEQPKPLGALRGEGHGADVNQVRPMDSHKMNVGGSDCSFARR